MKSPMVTGNLLCSEGCNSPMTPGKEKRREKGGGGTGGKVTWSPLLLWTGSCETLKEKKTSNGKS